MNIINLKRKNQDNPLDTFMKWLEPDIIKINQSILNNLLGSEPLVSDLSNHIIGSGGKRLRPLTKNTPKPQIKITPLTSL